MKHAFKRKKKELQGKDQTDLDSGKPEGRGRAEKGDLGGGLGLGGVCDMPEWPRPDPTAHPFPDRPYMAVILWAQIK